MKKYIMAVLSAAAVMIIASVAQASSSPPKVVAHAAWEGAKWLPNTCGADLVARPAEGNWWVKVSDESGTLYESSDIPAESYTFVSPLTVGGFSNDADFHRVTYEVANAANHQDGHVSYTQRQANCFGRSGPAGPAGPAGPPGVGTQGPAGPPGPGILVPINEPKSCSSTRTYKFVVRKRYKGELVTQVRAHTEGATTTVHKARSGKYKGRYIVTVRFNVDVGPFNSTRHITVTGKVGAGGRELFNEDADLCRKKNGHQNAPSASGEATPGV